MGSDKEEMERLAEWITKNVPTGILKDILDVEDPMEESTVDVTIKLLENLLPEGEFIGAREDLLKLQTFLREISAEEVRDPAGSAIILLKSYDETLKRSNDLMQELRSNRKSPGDELPELQKPPLGIMPKRNWINLRRIELTAAIQRYIEAGDDFLDSRAGSSTSHRDSLRGWISELQQLL
jgi:hypothetical protein